MNNKKKILERPMIIIAVSVAYIWLFTLSTFVASVGPPMVIAKIADTDKSMSFSDLKESFLIYAQESSKKLNLSYDFLLYSLLWNMMIFIPTLIIGFFLLRKKRWARNAMIGLLIILLLYPIAISTITSGFSSRILNFNMLIFPGIIYLLKRKNIESNLS